MEKLLGQRRGQRKEIELDRSLSFHQLQNFSPVTVVNDKFPTGWQKINYFEYKILGSDSQSS